MKLFSFLISCFLAFWSFYSPGDKPYIYSETIGNIEVYTYIDSENGKEWIQLKTEINAPAKAIANYARNVENLTDWVYNCEYAKILSVSDTSCLYYVVTDMPYPMTDRDAIIKKIMSSDEEKGMYTSISKSYQSNEMPSDYIRIPRFEATWIFERIENNRALVTYEMSVDVGGTVPDWIKSKFAVKGPYKTLEKLKVLFETGRI